MEALNPRPADMADDKDNTSKGAQNLGASAIQSQYTIGIHDNSSSSLVPEKLTYDNYDDWKRDVYLALITKNKLGFIDGTIQPPEPTSENYSDWYRADALVRSWLLHSISRDIVSGFKNYESARELFQSLEQHYGQPNAVQIYDIQHQIFTLIQSSISVSEYYTKIHALWLILDTLLPDLAASPAWRILKLVQFLHGLNDVYNSNKYQILAMDPLPSPEKAYSMILQVEKQMKGNRSSTIQESALITNGPAQNAPVALAFARRDPKSRYCTKCKREGHKNEDCFVGTNKRPKWWFDIMRRNGKPIPPHIEMIAAVSDTPTNGMPLVPVTNHTQRQSSTGASSSGISVSNLAANNILDAKLQNVSGDTSLLKQLIQAEIQKMFKTSTDQGHAISQIEFTGKTRSEKPPAG